MADIFDVPDFGIYLGDYDGLVLILFSVIALLVATIIALRFFLRRSARLNSDRCPVCGGKMRRIRQIPWARMCASVLPLRTLYCSRCRQKSVRVKPLAVGTVLEDGKTYTS